MISVLEAEKIIRENTDLFADRVLPLREAAGEVLREEVCSDRDQPPFDRVTMDGIAVAFKAWEGGRTFFPVEAVSQAGAPRKKLEDGQKAIEVMTGSVLPEGCDSVIRYEDLEKKDGAFAIRPGTGFMPGQNVHPRASDLKAGDPILDLGQVLNGPRLGVLASVGKVRVRVACRPKIAILSTGDELVDADREPEPFQIRKSNPSAIQAVLRDRGYCQTECLHAKDGLEELRDKARELLSRNDVLILSGGVSMGRADFVPEALKSLGVSVLFHKVAQKPGKPLLFGKTSDGKRVFGLPGNPVSVLVCLTRYVLPALDRGLGRELKIATVLLGEDFQTKGDFTWFIPVRARLESGCMWAEPCPTNTSGDFSSLAHSDGFVEMRAGKARFSKGEALPFFSWGAP